MSFVFTHMPGMRCFFFHQVAADHPGDDADVEELAIASQCVRASLPSPLEDTRLPGAVIRVLCGYMARKRGGSLSLRGGKREGIMAK